jgi:hypothetical protein
METTFWDAMKVIAADPRVNAQRPNKGTTVRVIEGKRMGVVGLVTWHGVNKRAFAWKYCSDAQASLREVNGRYGYRVRVHPEGEEPFFIDAEKVCVL